MLLENTAPLSEGRHKKTPGQVFSESPFPVLGASVQKRAGEVHEDRHMAAMKPNTKLDTPADATGPIEAKIST